VTAVRIGVARRQAIERIVSVLQHGAFADQVASDAATLGLAKQPAPDPRHIFAEAPDVSSIEDNPRNYPVAVYVWPDGPRSIVQRKTAGPTRFSAWSEIRVVCVVVFKQAVMEAPVGPSGIALDGAQTMRLRAESYSASIAESVLAYAMDSDNIHEIRFEGDEAFPVETQKFGVVGVGAVTFTVGQRLSVPNKLQLP